MKLLLAGKSCFSVLSYFCFFFFSFFKENDLFLSLWNVCLREEPFLFVETVAETAFQSSEEKMNLGHRLMFCIAYHLNLN